MYRETFGTKKQIQFESPEDYYEFIGFLAKGDGTTKITWEPNHESGAWGEEGRVHFYIDHPAELKAHLLHTAGTGTVISRVNCNEFVENIVTNHSFEPDDTQDSTAIRKTIPNKYLDDFDRGLAI
ncbi:MAG: hypothetical protein K1X52_12215 [Pyrinomonadaceae bacterium]|nr:hypothetical protein [Pyrinomonadaceae bacterium]